MPLLPIALAVALLAPIPAQDRMAGSSRREEAGWVYVALKGAPRDIGFQYGTLLAAEILDAHQALRPELVRNTGKDWNWFRDEAKRMFWDKLDQEYRDEIEGQAEGLKAQGVAIDAWDVLAFNAHIELEGYYIPWLADKPSNKEACSAFVATGSATADGKPVMGHNLWWSYLMGQRFNAILDITPQKGNRIVMDALCGFIHSGSDFAITSAGLSICETTISGFKGFDPKGLPEFMRMRKATQYAKDIDEWAAIMRKGNNGGYANTWLLADMKTGEIGKLELGLKNVVFHRSTDGYYVGSNFPEDPKLIREEIPGGWDPNPKRNGCEQRRARWKTLLTENAGKVDAERAKGFLADTFDEVKGRNEASNNTICGVGAFNGAINTKVVSAELAGKMSFWARMGVSDGRAISFQGARSAGQASPFLRDVPSQPWVQFRG